MVECPFQNPKMRGPRKAALSIKEGICLNTKFSKNFDRGGKIKVGRKSSSHCEKSFFRTGETVAVFHIVGTEDVSKRWFIMWLRGDARNSATGLIID